MPLPSIQRTADQSNGFGRCPSLDHGRTHFTRNRDIDIAPQGPAHAAPVHRDTRTAAQQQAQQQPLTFTATTDDQGKFQFNDVDQGPYRVVAARNGFARQEYGQRSFNRPGTVINIREGQQVNDISFRLIPASTISGRVMDSNGEPLPGITVQALRSTYDATGSARCSPRVLHVRMIWANTAFTGSIPVRYFVSANPARSALETITASASQAANKAQNPEQAQQAAQAASMFGPTGTPNEVADPGFGLTYYPNSPEVSRAVALELQPGAEQRAIDFTLVRSQRVRLTGRVIDTTTGRPPRLLPFPSVRAIPPASSPLDFLIGMDPSQGNRYNPTTGEFVVQNVASGSYWLQVLSQGQAPTPAPMPLPLRGSARGPELHQLCAHTRRRARFGYRQPDVERQPRGSVTGRVHVEGVQPSNPADLQRFGISLQSTSRRTRDSSPCCKAAVRPAADGTFSIPRMSRRGIQALVNGLGPTFYMKEARFGQTDALNTFHDFGADQRNAGNRGANESRPGQRNRRGRDVKACQWRPGGAGSGELESPGPLQNASTDQEGRFTFRGITPGDYRIFAWEDIEPFAYFDPAVVKQYEAAGKLVRIQESSAETAEVRIIPAETP